METRLTPTWRDAEAALATPYFDAVRTTCETLRANSHWPSLAALNTLVAASAKHQSLPRPPRFVATPDDSLSAMQYETQIAATGEIPTRDNWHDLFNAMQWLAFPQMKFSISVMHAKLLAEGGSTEAQARSTPRDVLTMFDESGVIVASHDTSLLQLIREFRWRELFVARRADVVRDIRFILVGHGLMEKALTPFVGMTGKAMLLHVEADADLDLEAALWLGNQANLQNSRNLAPLPLLGIPGWDLRNVDAAFYDNAQYFRAGYTRDIKK